MAEAEFNPGERVMPDIHTLLREIRQSGGVSLSGYLAMGKRWKIIRDMSLWKDPAAGYDYAHSFREFHEKETCMSHRTVNDCIKVYEAFGPLIEKMDTAPAIEGPRLVRLLPVVKKDGNAEEWLHKAIQLSKKDFNNSLREAKDKLPTDKCSHPREKQEKWIRCGECGKWQKPSENDLLSVKGHNQEECGCTYLGFNAYSCGHVDAINDSENAVLGSDNA